MREELDSPLSGRMSSGFGGSGKYKSKIVFGVAFIASVPLLLSTFAASVTVGTGSLEFGQGSQQATACDENIFVALGQEWYGLANNENLADPSDGYFRVRSITVSNLDLDACAGKKLRVRLIDRSSSEIQVGTMGEAKVLQISLPNPVPASNISDKTYPSLGLSYLTGIGAPISTTMNAEANISVSGTSIYDGSILSTTNSDATFFLEAGVNINGQGVFRTTVETIDNPGSRIPVAPSQPAPSDSSASDSSAS